MGNYKTRPKQSFSDELYRKIQKSYAVLLSRLEAIADGRDDQNVPEDVCQLLRGVQEDCVEPVKGWLQSSDYASASGFAWCGMPLLNLAVLCNSYHVVALLISEGMDVEKTDWVEFTSLHLAAFYGYKSVASLLLACGADPNRRGSVGESALHLAALQGHVGVAKELLAREVSVDLKDREGNNALHFCAKSGRCDLLNALLESSIACSHDQNVHGETPLHIACYLGHLEFAKILLEKCGLDSLVKENIFSETPLHCACSGGRNLHIVAFLLKQPGVNINFQGCDGHTALHSACYNGHTELVAYLLEQGADSDINAHSYVTDAGYDSSQSFLRDMDFVQDAGFKSSLQASQTPIMWAYEKGFDPIVNILKQRKAEQTNRSGRGLPFVPLPSPLGKLRSITKEKAEVLQLRNLLDSQHQIELSDIDFQEAIGSGSFGRVYKGLYKGNTVAIKRYRPTTFGSKSDTEMFCREVSILSRLFHPNILRFIGASLNDPSQFALVTEFASGGSLFSLLHEHKTILQLKRKMSIGLDVAKGMNYLHCLPTPIIHRDLNSHNILLTEERAIVADFGESRFFGSSTLDMTKQPGNLRWMAPEVFLQSTRYTCKADVFSYALCLWEVSVGDLPFSHLKPAAAALEMACKGSRPSLSKCIPESLQAVIVQCWKERPEERPEFSYIADELQRIYSSISEEDEVTFSQPFLPIQLGVPPLSGRGDAAATHMPVVFQDLLKIVDKNGYVVDTCQNYDHDADHYRVG